MTIETSKIKNVRLLSGEELVAEISGETDTSITLKNPVGIGAQQERPTAENPNPQPKLGFMPWAVLVDEDYKRNGITISKSIVIYVAPLRQELEAGYRQLFGKLVIPGAGQRLFVPQS